MYKKLLEKGFKPIYYTNIDWHESRNTNTRLFYRYNIRSKELLNVILNVLDLYDNYFYLITSKNVVYVYIEVENNLESSFMCVENAEPDLDNIELSKDDMHEILEILPNAFEFEYCDN